MRAEGVLRLILNISLYVGMTVLEDGKHVRSTVFEDKERRLVTFRVSPLSILHSLHPLKSLLLLKPSSPTTITLRSQPSSSEDHLASLATPTLTPSSDLRKQHRNYVPIYKITFLLNRLPSRQFLPLPLPLL
jgi:hypothetical protein